MFALFVHRESGRREAGFGKGPHGDCDMICVYAIVNRCATGWAEIECDLAAFIANTYVLLRLPLHRYRRTAKSRLGTKHATGSTLTGQTVAHRHPQGIFSHDGLQLAAATGCSSDGHGGLD